MWIASGLATIREVEGQRHLAVLINHDAESYVHQLRITCSVAVAKLTIEERVNPSPPLVSEA
jgi:hypothetical protein